MDLFGLVHVRPRTGKKYTLVIMDEYSRFTWVFFLRNKFMSLKQSSLSLNNVKFFMITKSGNSNVITKLNLETLHWKTSAMTRESLKTSQQYVLLSLSV